MSKYIKLEDAIRKYAEMIADEAYWEHGVGNGKPDEEGLDIAREYYSDLPTIEVSEDCISRADMLDTYAELYDVFDDYPYIIVELHKVYDKLNGLSNAISRAEGEWVHLAGSSYRCSKCNEYTNSSKPFEKPRCNYCPNCGAKMRLE